MYLNINSIKFLVIGILLSISLLSFSQEQKVDLKKLPQFFYEVYGSTDKVLTSRRKETYTNFLERVSFIYQEYQSSEEYKKLSSIDLKNKYNQNLTYDQGITSTDNFNPLKYFFKMYADHNQFYRIDNSNYLIKIKQKN